LLKGAQTCINFNGSLTSYFKCKRGLRQGDPLSSLLFDLVTDTLCQILFRGKCAGIIGLEPVLDNGYMIINFLYADDTVFFLKADVKCLDATLLALHAFKVLSGIKINFGKTELIPVNLTDDEASLFVVLACCKLSQFSLNYLGVPLSDKKLCCSEWNDIIDKVKRKLLNPLEAD
jgi:Reverse transcriptase (RNA-dependent DNA polymerase)